MHRLLTRTLVALAASGLVLSATTTSADATFGRQDYVIASVINNPNDSGPLAWFSIAAASGSSGQNAGGVFKAVFQPAYPGAPAVAGYSAQVTCLRVAGKLATVVGRITTSADPMRPVGTLIRVRFEDGGLISQKRDKIQIGTYLGDPTVCPDPVVPDREPITFGVVAVYDAR